MCLPSVLVTSSYLRLKYMLIYFICFFFNYTATSKIYTYRHTLSLPDALPIYLVAVDNLGEARAVAPVATDYRPTDPQIAWFLARFVARSEEHTSELQSLMCISYAVFCLIKKEKMLNITLI